MGLKKYYGFGDDKPPIYFRPFTSDVAIIDSNVTRQTDYRFPVMEPKVVFDIGGNIGVTAAVLANIYPSAKIHTFEPIKSNYEILLKNTEPYTNITPHMHGLANLDHVRELWPSDDEINHGGFSMEIDSGKPKISCQMRAMYKVCEEFGAPEVIKIDVEGAEYEILTAMPDWALAETKWIAGELHGIKDFLLLEYLKEKFQIQVQRNFGDIVYHFHAQNKGWARPVVQET